MRAVLVIDNSIRPTTTAVMDPKQTNKGSLSKWSMFDSTSTTIAKPAMSAAKLDIVLSCSAFLSTYCSHSGMYVPYMHARTGISTSIYAYGYIYMSAMSFCIQTVALLQLLVATKPCDTMAYFGREPTPLLSFYQGNNGRLNWFRIPHDTISQCCTFPSTRNKI